MFGMGVHSLDRRFRSVIHGPADSTTCPTTLAVAAALTVCVFGSAVFASSRQSPRAARGDEPAAVAPTGGERDLPAPQYPGPELARLAMFVGRWSVTETHFNVRGDVAATVKGTEEIAWLLDRHAIRRVYRSGTDAAAYHAIGLLTWNTAKGRYDGVWLDNGSTPGVTTVYGKWKDETHTMVFNVESSGKNGSTVRHEVVERFVDDEHRVATTYLLKGAEVIKRMEVRYVRAVPCPARVRPIFDDTPARPGD